MMIMAIMMMTMMIMIMMMKMMIMIMTMMIMMMTMMIMMMTMMIMMMSLMMRIRYMMNTELLHVTNRLWCTYRLLFTPNSNKFLKKSTVLTSTVFISTGHYCRSSNRWHVSLGTFACIRPYNLTGYARRILWTLVLKLTWTS